MTVLSALLAIAMLQATGGPPSTRRAVVMNRIEIPDEIAPAIAPYLRCRLDSIGQATYSGAGGPRIAPSVPVGADCSNVRAEAARLADRMLIDQGRGNGDERRAFVERALASADAFAASAVPATPSVQEKPDAED